MFKFDKHKFKISFISKLNINLRNFKKCDNLFTFKQFL